MTKCLVWAPLTMMLAISSSGLLASDGVNDVIRLENEGVSEEVMLAYVQNANIAYDPTADEIETLGQEGVPDSVVLAMIDRGDALRGSADVSASATDGAALPAAPGPQPPPDLRDNAVEVSAFYAPPSEELNISFFYGSLAPYGSWHMIEGRGYCFRPTVVTTVVDWRPYCHGGHWEHTDYGWYWVSDYPWGWATFHYGRWFEDPRHGWVWVPDTTWGPSWVHWRRSDTHYGWAPLPPEARFRAGVGFSFHNRDVGFNFHFGLNESSYSFVPVNSFLAVDLDRVRVPRSRTRNVYNNTTIVNNTYVYNDNRIINNGIPVSQVSASTGRTVESVQVTDMNVVSGQTFQRGEVREGRRLAVFRPQVRNEAPAEPAAAAVQTQERIKAAARRSGAQGTEGGRSRQQSPEATTSPAQNRERLEVERAKRSQVRSSEKQGDPDEQKPSVEQKPATKAPAVRQQESATGQAQRQEDARRKLEEEKARRQTVQPSAEDAKARARRQTEEARRREESARKAVTEKAERDAKAKAQQQAEEAKRREESARKAATEKAERDAKAKAQQQAEEARRNEESARKAAEEKARREAEKVKQVQPRAEPRSQRAPQPAPKGQPPQPKAQPKAPSQPKAKKDEPQEKRDEREEKRRR